MKVERISIKVCSCWILKNRIGDDFEASVTGIEEWGIYVSIPDPIAEGLVRFRDIAGEDFYVFNPDQGLVDPLRGQADFSILEKLSSEPKKRRRQGESRDSYRDVHERADRAAAAEALGYVSQPDDDDFDAMDIPPRARNRAARRKSLQQNHQRGGKKNSGFSENRGKDRRKKAQKRR